MVTIRGREGHSDRLKRIRGPEMVREMSKAVYAAADYLSTEAAISITTGAVSGKHHVPSQPGQPPNADTHVLDRSVHTEKAGTLKALSVADAPYAASLEFGTSKMAERPYMRPAADKTREQARDLVIRGAKRVIKGQRV